MALRWFILLSTLVPLLLQAGDVFRWRDAQGQMHYAQMLPANLPAGTPFDKVNLAITPPPLPQRLPTGDDPDQALQAQAPAAGPQCDTRQQDALQYELKHAGDLLEQGQHQCQLRYPGGDQSQKLDFLRCLHNHRYQWQQSRAAILQHYPCT